jgi:protein AbiQ
MSELKLYTINDEYIKFLSKYDNKIMFNKSSKRKYLGIVLSINNFNYFVPLSSPKTKDYIIENGIKKIRKDTITIIRIIVENKNKELELKGTLKFNNMIPVPDKVLTYYDINNETDNNYKILVIKELLFIRKNTNKIMKNAKVLYNQKIKNYSFPHLKFTLNFRLLEKKSLKF